MLLIKLGSGIIQALQDKQMWNDVLFITSSDNGGPVTTSAAANNYSLKGGKHSDWQGGVRVNAFVSGGYLPEQMRGKKTEGYIHIADWYATFCAWLLLIQQMREQQKPTSLLLTASTCGFSSLDKTPPHPALIFQ